MDLDLYIWVSVFFVVWTGRLIDPTVVKVARFGANVSDVLTDWAPRAWEYRFAKQCRSIGVQYLALGG